VLARAGVVVAVEEVAPVVPVELLFEAALVSLDELLVEELVSDDCFSV